MRRKLFIMAMAMVSILMVSCNQEIKTTVLPILGERELVSKVVNGESIVDTIYQTIPDFEFINQDSLSLTAETFKNSVYVADFFFTRCPSICPIMHRNMLEIYEKFKDTKEVMFLSHSIDAKYDTPKALKSYADRMGVTTNQWQFAHGSKEAIFAMAPAYLSMTPQEDSAIPGGYNHQGWFVLVDKERRIRGAYDGTVVKEVKVLMEDIETLLKEYQE